MYKSKLPAEPTALVLGIIGLVIGIASCCCYGITAIIPLGLSIAGLVIANKSLRAYRENPEAYERGSYTNVNTARIINIIAVTINSIIVLFVILILLIYGSIFSAAMFQNLEDIRSINEEQNYEEYDDYEWESDSTEIEVEDYIFEEEIDSVTIDSVR